MPATRRPGHARVVFDDVLWHDDLERASAKAAAAAAAARGQLERHGAPIDQLRPCQEHGRDDTRLRGCLKLYVPPPAGPWGIVFQLAIDERLNDGRLVLRPNTGVDAIIERTGGGRPLTPDEFEQHFGHLPTDDEG